MMSIKHYKYKEYTRTGFEVTGIIVPKATRHSNLNKNQLLEKITHRHLTDQSLII